MANEPGQDKGDKGDHLKLQTLIYIVGLAVMALVVSTTPPDQKVVVLGMMITGVLGAQNLVKTRQGTLTDQKVDKDIEATNKVAKSLNGGFDERVQKIVEDVLASKLPEAIAKALSIHDRKPKP